MATALREHPVSAFPVVDDDGTAIGVVSEPGVISGILHYRDQVKARGVTAADLMTTAVVAVRDRLDYPSPERPGDRYDVLACFPMD